jgi:alpha-1,2-mannosyltransferase
MTAQPPWEMPATLWKCMNRKIGSTTFGTPFDVSTETADGDGSSGNCVCAQNTSASSFGLHFEKWLPTYIAGVLGVVVIVLLVQTYSRAYQPGGNDMCRYVETTTALLQGLDPWVAGVGVPYPLFFGFIFIPLAIIPHWATTFLWFVISVACLFASCLVLLKAAMPADQRIEWRRFALPSLLLFLVFFEPIQNNLLNGQVNTLVLFCCAMFFRCFSKEKPIAASAWLAAGISIKLFPVFLLVFVLVRRQYRILFWTPVFTILFCLLPFVIVGPRVLEFYQSYLRMLLVPAVTNFSNGGIHSYFVAPLGVFGVLKYYLPSLQSSYLARGICLVVALTAMLAVDIATRGERRENRDLWAFCACMLGCLFMSPISEKHHLIYAVPAVLLVGYKLFFDRSWITGPVLTLAVAFILCFDLMQKSFITVPFYFISLIAVLFLLVLAAKDEHPQWPSMLHDEK